MITNQSNEPEVPGSPTNTDRADADTDDLATTGHLTDSLIERAAARLAEEPDTVSSGPSPALLNLAWKAAQAHAAAVRVQPKASTRPVPSVAALTPAKVASVNAPAANADWYDVPVHALAAATESGGNKHIRRVPPSSSAQRFTLTQAPLLDGNAVSLIFKADPEALDQYLGCTIRVTIGSRVFDLGPVRRDGVAKLRVEGQIDDSKDSVVRIHKPKTPAA